VTDLGEIQIDLEEAIAATPTCHQFWGLPARHYSCVVADPPWRFATWSETRQTRAAANHYDVMSLDAIKALPVSDLAYKDCVLLLWASNPMLPHALDVMRAWGFRYSTVAFTWAKTTKKTDESWTPAYHMGLGYWTRQNAELCLLGVRGKPKRIGKGVRQLIVAPRREHSRKPEMFFDRVTDLVPGPYCELFSRQSRAGWATWGNEQEKFG
jgi:N6-adenosine-specific RNA methylase IME4